MSVISLPRRIDTRRPLVRERRVTQRVAVSREVATHRRSSSSQRKSAVIVVLALALALGGSMVEADRQIEIHALQSQLLQDQSTYAVQVGSLTNLSAPSQIATQAGALHLVDPTSITQIPSTSLDEPLPLPKFLGYAPATSRTIR